MKRVVITGVGIYSCIGTNISDVEASLRSGRSGIGIAPERTNFGYRSPLTGILPPIDVKKILDRKTRQHISEHGVYAYVSAKEALQMAGINQEIIDNEEIGVIYGNDSSIGSTVKTIDTVREKRNTTLIGSGSVFQTLNSTITMNLSAILGLRGVGFTISSACASGSHAIGVAYTMIRAGLQQCILCGGAQEVNDNSVMSFDGLGVFSTNVENPQMASRPFDCARNGLVPSGGGASLVLESLDFALERGAHILAEVIGYGYSSDGVHVAVPTNDGPKRAIYKALCDAKLQPTDIDYINAHATSTIVGDANEARLLTEIFGGKPWVSSTKSMTGHEMWMAGASEAIYSLIMMQGGFVAPNINLEHKDQSALELKIPSESVAADLNIVMSNSFGFGGTNSTLILKKYQI